AAWNSAKASSTAPANPAWFGPAAPKVKGGWDFSGNDYDATVAGSTPQPDPNPLDCNGHGSHTSGTATGFRVLSSGATYSGTYNTNAKLFGVACTTTHALLTPGTNGRLLLSSGASMAISGRGCGPAFTAEGVRLSVVLTGQVKVLGDNSANLSVGCKPVEYS